MKLFLFLLLGSFVILIPKTQGQRIISQEEEDVIFLNPETSPRPKQDFQKEGLVVVRFIVDLKGKVITPKIMKGIDPRIDRQILDIICDIEFIPGTFYEKEIPMYVNLPLRIILEK
jgi:hypothetical protein